ncbi:MAG: SCO family protein [Polyangiaceae bacterium]|nr:SCO family protein [Polyangiaceae bacterium]
MSLLRSILSRALGAALLLTSVTSWGAPVDPSEIKTRTEPLPKRLEGVDVEEHLGQVVPQGVSFRNATGATVVYHDVVQGDLPTILTMNYSDCPMLCSLQLNALVASLKQLDLTLGKDFRIVTVTLDPNETLESAKRTKEKYLKLYDRQDADPAGWSFLTGSDQNIHQVAEALGIQYNYNEKRDEYVHPASFLISTPDGEIARYIYGLEYHPETLRLSLVEASEGKIGSSIDRLVLYCFHYDASEGRYAPVAMNIMRVAGSSGALALGGLLFGLWRYERRRKSAKPHHLPEQSLGSAESVA